MVMTWCCIILFRKTWRLLNVRPANRSFYRVSPSGSWVFGEKTSRRCVASHPWKLHLRVLGVWWHGPWLDHHKHQKSELVLLQTMNQRESIWIKWILDIWDSWDIYHSPPWLLRAAGARCSLIGCGSLQIFLQHRPIFGIRFLTSRL